METLKQVRERVCLSQHELAEKVGMPVATINRIELRKQDPIPRTKRKIAAALGVDPVSIDW